MTNKNKAKVVKDPESESGLSLVFPEEVMKELDWKEGDELTIKIDTNGKIIVSKKE